MDAILSIETKENYKLDNLKNTIMGHIRKKNCKSEIALHQSIRRLSLKIHNRCNCHV